MAQENKNSAVVIKPNPKGGKPQEQPNNQEPATVNFPPSINANVSGKLKVTAETRQADHHKEWYHEPNAWVAVFTGCLFAATAILAVFTYKLWRATKSLVDKSEESSKKIERAYVFVTMRIGDPGIVRTHEGTATTYIHVFFTNHGKTPAIISKIRGYGNILNEPPRALLPAAGGDIRLPEGLVIAPGKDYFLSVEVRISHREWGEMERIERNLYCVGMIEYKDILGETRETGYCWEFRVNQGNFVFCRSSDLNYTK